MARQAKYDLHKIYDIFINILVRLLLFRLLPFHLLQFHLLQFHLLQFRLLLFHLLKIFNFYLLLFAALLLNFDLPSICLSCWSFWGYCTDIVWYTNMMYKYQHFFMVWGYVFLQKGTSTDIKWCTNTKIKVCCCDKVWHHTIHSRV